MGKPEKALKIEGADGNRGVKKSQRKPKYKKKVAKSANIRVFASIPDALFSWCSANNADCAEMLQDIINQTGIEAIHFRKERYGRASYEIVAETTDEAKKANLLVEAHLKHQIDLHRLAQRNEELESFLEATQQEMDQGLRVEFPIPESMLGIAIGSGGANIKSVKEKTGVDKIIVDNKAFLVRIAGKSKEAVQEARRLMEFSQERVAVCPAYLKQVTTPFGYGNFNKLREIQQNSRVISILPIEDAIEIIGLKAAVETARLLLQTDMRYFDKMHELNQEKQQIQTELRKIDAAYGYRNPTGGKRGGKREKKHE